MDATLQPFQLQRYLNIDPSSKYQTFVTLFSKRWIEIPNSVLENPNYKRPKEMPHFFWTDLFKALPKPKSDNFGIDILRSSFLDYMELIGFSPSSLNQNWSKLFEDRTIDENQKVQKEFGRKLTLIRSWLNEQNFKVTAVSHAGLKATPKSGPLLKLPVPVYFLVITPAKARKDLISREHAAKLNTEVLRVALIFDTPEPPDYVQSLYQSFPTPLQDPNNILWWPTTPYNFSIKRVRFEFVSNLDRFLEKDFEIEEKIKKGCVAVINEIYQIIKYG